MLLPLMCISLSLLTSLFAPFITLLVGLQQQTSHGSSNHNETVEGRSQRHTYQIHPIHLPTRLIHTLTTHLPIPSFTIHSHLSHLTDIYGRLYNIKGITEDKVQGRNWKQFVRAPSRPVQPFIRNYQKRTIHQLR